MKGYLILIGLCLRLTCLAQPFNYTVYREPDGLPSGYTECTLEDSRGFLWICTFGGLSRFDGRNFVNYGVKEGLPDVKLDALYEDGKGRLWIGTRRGLSVFNGKNFTNYRVPGIKGTTYIFTIFEARGRLYCICNSACYSLQGDTLKRAAPVSSFTDSAVRSWHRLDDNRSIVGTTTAYYLVTSDGKFSVIKDIPGAKRSGVVLSSQEPGVFYAVNKYGLYRWQNGKGVRITDLDFTGAILTGFFVDNQKRIWVSAEGRGIWVISNLKDIYFKDINTDFPGMLVPHINQDRQGNIWLCNFRGLVKATDKYITHYDKSTGMYNDDIRSSDRMYDGSLHFGFSLVDSRDSITSLPDPLRRIAESDSFYGSLGSVQKDQQGRMWAYAYDHLYYWNKKTVRDIAPMFKEKGGGSLYYDTAFNMLYVTRGEKLFGVKDDSIVLTITNDAAGKPLEEPDLLYKDNFGNLWVNGDKTLYVYTHGKMINMMAALRLPQPVDAMAACSDKTGVWVYTYGFGVIHLKYNKDGTYERDDEIDTGDGLPGNIVRSLTIDGNGHLWMGVENGLCHIDPSKKNADGSYIIHPVGPTDGLHVISWSLSYLHTARDGNVWLGTPNGVFRIDLSRLQPGKCKPDVFIEAANVTGAGDTWRWNKTDTSQFFTLPDQASFTYAQNNIRFHFTGMNLKTGTIRYAWMLVGLDKAWQINQSADEVQYNNLPPGDYVFKVKATNDEGLESKEAQFVFHIKPPFWQTWWFRVLAALVAVAIIYYLIRQRDKRHEMENNLALQMSELKLTALQSQMNPHFIFNSLNSIQNYIMQKNPVEAARYLSKFSKLIRRILDQSFSHLKPMNEILETLRMYIELEAFRFSNEFTYSIEADEDDDTMNAMLPPMLLQPFVENAIIHGLMPKEGPKHLTIKLFTRNGNMVVMVDDNGNGRNFSEKRPGHISRGQKLTQDMLATLKQLQGVEATISYIDKTDADGNATGTTVVIEIPVNNPLPAEKPVVAKRSQKV